MNEIKMGGVGQTAHWSLLHKANSVITVGNGRGFVIEHRVFFDFGNGLRRLRRKLVLTASHCLPHPPKMPCYSWQETTYANMLAPLGEEPSVWAECLFFDPVSDLAILGEPDNQEVAEQWDAYMTLVDGRKPFAVAAPETGEGYMLALDGVSWQPTPVKVHTNMWSNSLSTGPNLPGQSGSPIVDAKGRAVALVSKSGGAQPTLKSQLPPWLLRATKGRSDNVVA